MIILRCKAFKELTATGYTYWQLAIFNYLSLAVCQDRNSKLLLRNQLHNS
jgi:hypothetical protein